MKGCQRCDVLWNCRNDRGVSQGIVLWNFVNYFTNVKKCTINKSNGLANTKSKVGSLRIEMEVKELKFQTYSNYLNKLRAYGKNGKKWRRCHRSVRLWWSFRESISNANGNCCYPGSGRKFFVCQNLRIQMKCVYFFHLFSKDYRRELSRGAESRIEAMLNWARMIRADSWFSFDNSVCQNVRVCGALNRLCCVRVFYTITVLPYPVLYAWFLFKLLDDIFDDLFSIGFGALVFKLR